MHAMIVIDLNAKLRRYFRTKLFRKFLEFKNRRTKGLIDIIPRTHSRHERMVKYLDGVKRFK